MMIRRTAQVKRYEGPVGIFGSTAEIEDRPMPDIAREESVEGLVDRGDG